MKLKIRILAILCATITFSMGFVISELYNRNIQLKNEHKEESKLFRERVEESYAVAYEQEKQKLICEKELKKVMQELKSCKSE